MVWVHRIPSKRSSSSREPFPAHAFRQACAAAGGRGRGCSSPVGRPSTAATPPHQTWAGGNCMTACLFVHLLHAQPVSPADFSSLGHVSNDDPGCWGSSPFEPGFSSKLSTIDPWPFPPFLGCLAPDSTARGSYPLGCDIRFRCSNFHFTVCLMSSLSWRNDPVSRSRLLVGQHVHSRFYLHSRWVCGIDQIRRGLSAFVFDSWVGTMPQQLFNGL